MGSISGLSQFVGSYNLYVYIYHDMIGVLLRVITFLFSLVFNMVDSKHPALQEILET